MDEKDRVVGMAETKVAKGTGRFVAYGLGSCVGVTLYDPRKKVGGMAHIMLPSSREHSPVVTRPKFADTAIDDLLEEILRLGAKKDGLEAKLVGGANMFTALYGQSVPIGLRNVMAARKKLMEAGVRLAAEEVGGSQGRTVAFSLEDGRIQIKKWNQAEQWI
jgi:chemotaxis protein CheD